MIAIPLPQGFALPEGVRPDEEFSEMVTLKMSKDGSHIILLDVGGSDVEHLTSDNDFKEDEGGRSMSADNQLPMDDDGYVSSVLKGIRDTN